MKGKRAALLTSTIAITALATLAAPTLAWASPAPSAPLAQGLVGPLQIDVGDDGEVYVAQSFAGLLTRVWPAGTTKNLLAAPGIAGVASRDDAVAFTWTGEDPAAPGSGLNVRRADGSVRTVADLYAFEKTHNPDAKNRYGFLGLPDWCAKKVPAEIPGATPYRGVVDSHPYALANAPDGGWYVAEAGGNAILHVSRAGRIHVVAVLPPQRATVPAAAAAGMGLPACTVGKTYAFEPVPTDVEVGANGMLYVTLLPGGPEDASLGARGSVVRIDPATGSTRVLARGLLGAANLALAPHGRIFVAELFAGRISMVKDGHVTPYVDVPSPAGLEYARGKLYATVDVFANGSLVTIQG